MKEIVRINEKGEIKLPEGIRDCLGMVEGMHVLLKADVNRRELLIVPFSTAEGDLVEFKVILNDIPGSLAQCASFLSKHNINLVASESRTLQGGEIAEWIVVADISKCNYNVRELCGKLKDEGYAKKAICRSYQ